MPRFWERWFGKRKQESKSFTLVDYAQNYLTVFEVATNEERTQHAAQLFDAANDTAKHVGSPDLFLLIKNSDVAALGEAAAYSWQRFETILQTKDGYWLSAFALTHLIILNYAKTLDNAPRAKQIAENAARLYSAEYARRRMTQ